MTHRVDGGAPRGAAGDGRTPGGTPPASSRPSGLDGLLGTGPVFTGALRGYDRLQVDDYVAWAETELLVLRRENDHLLSRYAASSGELQNARRRLAQLVRERASLPGPEESRALVRRAEEEVAALSAAAEEEARRVRAEAQTEAAARLAGVAEMREAISALREQARSEAAAVLTAARRAATEECARLRREAAEERARLDQEAAEERARADAEALERRRAVEAELEPLRDERDRARQWLRALTGQIDEALAVVTGVLPDDVSVLADKREAVRADEQPGDGAVGAPAGRGADVTALHGPGRPDIAAAS